MPEADPRQECAHRPRRPLWLGPLSAHLLRRAAQLPAGRAEPNPRTAGRIAGLKCLGRALEHRAAEIEPGLGGVWRASRTRSGSEAGAEERLATGPGLDWAVAQSLAEAQGGPIGVESTPGEGMDTL